MDNHENDFDDPFTCEVDECGQTAYDITLNLCGNHYDQYVIKSIRTHLTRALNTLYALRVHEGVKSCICGRTGMTQNELIDHIERMKEHGNHGAK